MKKYSTFLAGILSLLLVFGLLLTGCPMDGDDDTPAVITDLNLTGKVTAPVRGATPITTEISGIQYTTTIVWQTANGAPVTGKFAAGTVYKAVVTLAAKDGFTFTGVAENAFTYSGATAANAADSGTVTITFPATAAEGEDTVVNILDLTGKVIAPVRGATPVTTFSETTQYTGIIVWRMEGGVPVSGSFTAGTVYKAVVSLTAKDGFIFFTDVTKNKFTHDDATSVTSVANSGMVIVTITFPATAAAAPSPPGGKITFTGIGSQYNGQYVTFRSSSTTEPTGGIFLMGTISSTEIKGARISDGSVTIPVYLVKGSKTNSSVGPYNGNDKNIKIRLYIKGTASFTPGEVFEGDMDETYTINSVNFNNGSASVNVGGGGGNGSIIFTGIGSQYNGQYAMFRSASDTKPTGGILLMGITSAMTGVRISGGSVTFPVYLAENAQSTSLVPYTGSDQSIKIYLYIKGTASFTQDDLHNHTDIKYTINSVNFNNGSASVNVGGTPINAKWQGRYNGAGDYITVTANSVTYTGNNSHPPITNITTATGGNVMSNTTLVGEWVYILSSSTPVGFVMDITQGGQPTKVIAIGAQAVTDLLTDVSSYSISFSPTPPSISGSPTGNFYFAGQKE
jgi:hypothetical protein